MLITYFYLSKYKRLMLSNVHEFTWTPQSKFMVILGTNGSGKSSILEELTMCPANKNQFDTDGIKEIHCVHNGHEYKARSVYSGGTGKHSLTKDGVELNSGGTFQVQCDLVWQELREERKLHEVRIGLETFTNMPTAKRREWLTRLSVVDMGYAFEKFNSVNSAARDALGMIRHYEKRMSSENIDMPTDGEVRNYQEQLDTLNRRLELLYRHRGTQDITAPQYPIEERLNELMARAKTLLTTYPSMPTDEVYETREAFMEALAYRRAGIEHNQTQISTMMEELESYKSQDLSEDVKTDIVELDSLQQQLKASRDVYLLNEHALGSFKIGHLPLVNVSYERAQDNKRFVGFKSELYSVYTTIPENKDRYYNPNAARETKEKIEAFKANIIQGEAKLRSAQRKIEHIRAHDPVTCPTCTTEFVPGVDVNEIPTLEAAIEKIKAKLLELDAEIKAGELYLEQYTDYCGYLTRLRYLVNTYGEYGELFTAITSNECLNNTPRTTAGFLVEWFQAQMLLNSNVCIQQDIDVMQARIQRATDAKNDPAGSFSKHIEAMSESIDNLMARNNAKMLETNRLQAAGVAMDKHKQELDKLLTEFKMVLSDADVKVNWYVQKALAEETKATNLRLAEVQSKLNNFNLRNAQLKEMETDYKGAVNYYKDLQMISKALSPKEGLIGKYLNGFMTQVVKIMNSVIEEVWSYPMEVLPSKVENSGLDYNFPLSVNNGALLAPDIARGSSSQRDIVNFAFKLIVNKFLKYEDYPLILDEFGSTFDEQHRQNLIPFLNRYVEQNTEQQIFYVSHFSSLYGSFDHAEFAVINSTNITVPRVYNQNVIMR